MAILRVTNRAALLFVLLSIAAKLAICRRLLTVLVLKTGNSGGGATQTGRMPHGDSGLMNKALAIMKQLKWFLLYLLY